MNTNNNSNPIEEGSKKEFLKLLFSTTPFFKMGDEVVAKDYPEQKFVVIGIETSEDFLHYQYTCFTDTDYSARFTFFEGEIAKNYTGVIAITDPNFQSK